MGLSGGCGRDTGRLLDTGELFEDKSIIRMFLADAGLCSGGGALQETAGVLMPSLDEEGSAHGQANTPLLLMVGRKILGERQHALEKVFGFLVPALKKKGFSEEAKSLHALRGIERRGAALSEKDR